MDVEYAILCRVVKRSSYRLNSLILAGVLVGFTGTLLNVIQLDSSMSHKSAAICNVRVYLLSVRPLVINMCTDKVLDDGTSLCGVLCYDVYKNLEALQGILQ